MMRRIRFLMQCSLMMIILWTVAPLAAQTHIEQNECTVRPNGDFARVRSEWTTDGDEVARIGRNDDARYVVRGRNASDGFSWYFIGIGWVRADVVDASGDCSNLPVLFTQVGSGFNSEAYPCPADFAGYMPPRIQTGQTNVTVRDGGIAYFVYALPERDSSVSGHIPDGVTLDRIGIGPLCQDGLVFWEIVVSGVSGFVIESDVYQRVYYLDGGTDAPIIITTEAESGEDIQVVATPNTPHTPTQSIPLGADVQADLFALSPDGTRLIAATLNGGTFHIITLDSDSAVAVNTDSSFVAITFNVEGHILTVDAEGGISTWDATTGQQIRYQSLLTEAPQTDIIAAFSQESSRVALRDCADLDTTNPDTPICRRSVIRVFDVDSLQVTAEVNVPAEVSAVALSPFGNSLAVIADTTTILWPDVINDSGGRTVPTFMTPLTLTFNPGGTRLIVGGCAEASTQGETVVCNFSNIGAWTVDGNVTEVMRNRNISGGIVSVAFANDDALSSEQILAVATADNLHTIRLADGLTLRDYANDDSIAYRHVRLAPNHGWVIASTEDMLYLWER